MNVTIRKETPIADYVYQAGVDLGINVGEDYNDMENLEGVYGRVLKDLSKCEQSENPLR